MINALGCSSRVSDSRVDTVLGLEVANERKFQVRSQVGIIEAVEFLLDRAQFCEAPSEEPVLI